MERKVRALATALADGIAGFLAFQARCGVSGAYTEYLLYEPIIRISRNLGWTARCEFPLKKLHEGPGDNQRVDFMFVIADRKLVVTMEVKWPRQERSQLRLDTDISKLKRLRSHCNVGVSERLILIAGPHEVVDGEAKLKRKIQDRRLEPVVARVAGSGPGRRGVSLFRITDARRETK